MSENTQKLKTLFKNMFSLKEDSASHEEIRDRLLSGGKITGTNMCVLICAMIIASVGLITSSTAVIIGAMLVSPIMGSILAALVYLLHNRFIHPNSIDYSHAYHENINAVSDKICGFYSRYIFLCV